MPRPCGIPFLLRQEGFTGAEKALVLCCALAVVAGVGRLLGVGSQRAGGDAGRTLAAGRGALGEAERVGSLFAAGGVPQASGSLAPAGALSPAAAVAVAGSPAATGAVAPAAAAAPIVLTLGDTAGQTRKLTDAVYRQNLKRAGLAQINVTDPGMKSALRSFQQNWEKNRARYQAVATKTGVPAELIAAIHWRESDGDFNTYLHQGDPLGKPAKNWPTNIPVFTKWEEAAVHALNMKKTLRDDLGMTASTTDVAALATYAEHYNGLGYFKRGRVSPYVFSGTDQYSKGKYVRDGVFDANVRDRQLGVLAMLKSIAGTAPPVVAAQGPLLPRDGQPPAQRPRRRRRQKL